ncbi:TIGR04282 family arsenosugar biosynthesis glycosyltransferase [Aerococcus sp. UMB1112A]|uniref:TIGR04282 family arsenosugar biosynthesis glycosyltransferase n=1 Tax=Aerococcus sp. UMB1112A TaxID=3050609 RepID=UPI00254C531C|nr:TIGR04282 family arsenosugar biosynthesis glycosyltransferase [Aerococcus sp. UMB1112A]MDK8502590.1 TIGR04282 family arsenosugar biosynthesis glycosyltransferase [Aerococcus sp. UMB1112A]
MKKLLIIMTRLPLKGETKSRLSDFLTVDQTQALSQYLLEMNYQRAKASQADLCFWLTADQAGYDLGDFLNLDQEAVFWQEGDSLGERMSRAIRDGFNRGYDQVALMGSDLYDLSTSQVDQAFTYLDSCDLVLAPSLDGGYGLIGMSAYYPDLFALESYGHTSVLAATLSHADQAGISYELLPAIRDIDDKEDIAAILTGDPEATFLAQGEYNANFIFDQGRKLLRIALGSQLHLDQQIQYEYGALKALEASGVTPKPLALCDYHPLIGAGYLVEAFLPGRQLDYETDSQIAAELLAQIHQQDPKQADHLIYAGQPFVVMYEEFETMFAHYRSWEGRSEEVTQRIQRLLDGLKVYDHSAQLVNPCIINTELNASNFLINPGDQSYVIDWEKPLIGEREQDLGHFLAPTTTLWKTDYLYDDQSLESFIRAYDAHSPIAIDQAKLDQYLVFTCLRGLTWCAMAYVQYNKADKLARNQETYQVISRFLSTDFIQMIEDYIAKRLPG